MSFAHHNPRQHCTLLAHTTPTSLSYSICLLPRGLLSRHVTSEHLGLDPVEDDERSVAPGEAHADVGGAPENVGERATAGNVTEPPGDTAI